MLQVHDGQCGLCVHFGEHHAQEKKLVEIREEIGVRNDARRMRASETRVAASESHADQRVRRI